MSEQQFSTSDDLAHLEKIGISTSTTGWQMTFGENHWRYPESVGNDTNVDDVNFNSHQESIYAVKRMSALDPMTSEPFMMFEFMKIDSSAEADAEFYGSATTAIESMASNIEINSLRGQLDDAQDEVNGYFDDDMRRDQVKNIENKISVLESGVDGSADRSKTAGAWFSSVNAGAKKSFRGSVALYMPNDIQINDTMMYNEDSRKFGALIGAGLSNDGAGENVVGLGTIFNSVNIAAAGVALGKAIGGKASDAIGGLVGFGIGDVIGAEVNRRTGKVSNPNEYLQYKNTPLRTFTFSWTFLPDSVFESEQAAGIIKAFRTAAHATRESATLIRVPDTVILSIHGAADIIQIPPCYIESVSVTYNPNNSSFFKRNNAPVEIGLGVTLKEIVPIYADDVEGGY